MTIRALDERRVRRVLDEDGLLIDLRSTERWLVRHVAGSIPLLFEAGPGLGGRARDLLPLDARLVLLDDGASPLEPAAAALRGKGFEVVGFLPGGVGSWPKPDVRETPAVPVERAGPDLVLVHVGDPGTLPVPGARRLPAELLWKRAGELDPAARTGVLAGYGVWAAAAVGILERIGFGDLTLVRTRPPGTTPPMAGPEMFRIGGPGL